MNQTININQKNIQHFLKGIRKQLLLTHSKTETAAIIEMLQTSIKEFIEDNPTATIDDLKMHFSDSTNDIGLYNTDSTILEKNLKYSRTIKKIALIILLLAISAFIAYIGLHLKTYYDAQNALISHEIITIE